MITFANKKNIVTQLVTATLLVTSLQTFAQELYPLKKSDRLWHNEQQELRYKPDGTDFVITNGNRLFTRALYGTHTLFRVETGDRPEFALYMPGMGGNFKLGISSNDTNGKWLTKAQTITARYRAGSMYYTIQDPILGNGKLLLEVLAMSDAEGFIVKARFENVKTSIALFSAFGGATGKSFSREGDMGPDPESNFYLKPENCKDNTYAIEKDAFTLKYGSGVEIGQDGRYYVEDLKQPSVKSKERILVGSFPAGTVLKIGDATKLSTPQDFFNSKMESAPAIVGKVNAKTNTDYYFSIHNPATKPAFKNSEAPRLFAQAETARKSIADRITINTPDPYINTIGGTLAIASDATWEAPSYLHGSIGWRNRLNGWRGAYTADALGWHDRAKMHLESYAKSQVTSPASGPIVADTLTNLSRSQEKLGVGMFTSGYISRLPNGEKIQAHHYDMNLVFIDIMLRHYEWTGDREFLKETWPVLKRHLEWETRNFDSDRDGLYDAYAVIWASDALQYSGGGVAHSSAYNYYSFSKAAQIATILGEDPSPYRKEADKILKAMNADLWMKDKGSYAEYKDAMGNRLLHPAPALWTVYHSMDSETLNPFQAYQSLRYIDNEIPHIPIKAKGLEDDGYYTLSTTKWMPYEWSLNNSALAESMHTALANWQGGRADEAYKLFKSEVLASMYLGGSPGNFVQISHYDAARNEAYRDFGDPIGMFSRALVEGLFGIVPNALSNTLSIRPGLPSSWNYASFSTPDISFDFKRNGQTDVYTLVPKLPQSLNLKFQAIARGQVKNITINGKSVSWKNIDSAVGKPVIEITAAAAEKYVVNITWQGALPVLPTAEKTYANGGLITENFNGVTVLKINDPQNILVNSTIKSSGFSAKVNASAGNYTVFIQLSQGQLSWWMPICFNVEKTVKLVTGRDSEENSNSFALQNNTSSSVEAIVSVNEFSTSLNIPSGKTSTEIVVPENNLITGTNQVTITLSNGDTVTESLYNWKATTKGKLETVNITGYFNDKVTQIFKNKYLSPRPQVTTLQLPWQGIGDWPHALRTFDVDDSGLRKLAGEKNAITLPQGITFSTSGTAGTNNILYTSQWDNYPKEKSIPLAGSASHAWFLMAGSTNPMQSQFDNGIIIVEYTDGTTDSLVLRNPETWCPMEQDYYTDGFAFALKRPRSTRIHLKTGTIVSGQESKEKYNGKGIEGGAATVLDMPLNPSKTLKNITLKTIANDVVIGLMAVTLLR
ncbi:DUF4450 domain-containing protein [Flavobacterium gilvum]|uniref:Alpha-L-rhamnosidase six-hairpin glycosidase domain-containing protein n=1 Tax=Flavobacterium gilvum TaxID=1492737 RepID=A0AAC9N5M3_9FLAO|nr:DUF4450 domain-containing protein [Flavobacterium gilvum]AOW09971.1 hypothetical protein EM308_10870 [Flavobacterium gilvum]KFC58532.1 alpha-L-rhamnosidase [Flavobacterium gilvum]